jgi:hypothetical protein
VYLVAAQPVGGAKLLEFCLDLTLKGLRQDAGG